MTQVVLADAKRAGRTAPALIAADVGGTHARLAWVDTTAGSLTLRDYRCYNCADHAGLSAIIAAFCRETGAKGPIAATVAIAGLMVGDSLVHANMPWPVSRQAVRAEAGLQKLAFINDFEALAWAVPGLAAGEGVSVGCPEPAPADPAAPVLVIGPGTGLGVAFYLPATADQPARVLASEGGHAALSAVTARELAVLGELLHRWPHVDVERALSGPGLRNLYQALCALDGQTPQLSEPAAITAAALSGQSAPAREALAMFCSLLGSYCGDLALISGARRVVLAGGIPAQISDFLLASDFRARFVNKGVMGKVLESVPVQLVEHGQLALLGAAQWFLQRPAS